jgi:hypothetical protein
MWTQAFRSEQALLLESEAEYARLYEVTAVFAALRPVTGPIDPADYIEYEDRQETLRSMGRSEDLPDETEELRAFHGDYDRFGNE